MTWSPFSDRGDARADVDHDARALVAEDRREQPLRVLAGQRELVGVADAGGLDLDQHLAGLRAFELHMGDRERLARLERHRRTHVHVVLRIRVRPGFCHHQLRLRHDGGELAVAAGDAGLPDRGGAAAVQRRAFGLRHVALPGCRRRNWSCSRSWRSSRRSAGRLAVAAVPPRLSANAISAPPCSTPLRLVRLFGDQAARRSRAPARHG